MSAVQRPTRRVSRRWTVVLAVALLAPVGGAAAHAARTAPSFAGTTTISWTGQAKITLTVPTRIDGFTEDRMRLFVTGGTYAFVRIVGPLSPYCQVEFPHCNTWYLDYLRDLAGRWPYPTTGPGHDHATLAPFTPPFLLKGATTLFLFTDGRARLEIRPPRLSGRVTYTARDRFRGRAERLPIRCASGTCTSASGDPFLYGGTTFDVGKAPGSVDTLVFSTAKDAETVPGLVPAAQPHGVRPCVYPNLRTAPNASANPAHHPLGCDLAPQNADESVGIVETTANEATYAYPLMGVMLNWAFPDVTGPRYVGWHAASAGPAPTIRSAYAVWFSYTA